MADEVGTYAPITPVKPGRDRMPERDRAMERAAERLRQKRRRASHEGHGEGHGAFDDEILVLGIPRDEMTDNVRHALETLLEEINYLRAELMHAKEHEAYLEAQAESDGEMHVFFRRPFLARIMLAARRAQEVGAEFQLLYITARNISDVRQDLGPAAAQALLAQMAEAISEGLEPGDILGNLENSDFGVLLPGTSQAEAKEKAAAIAAILKGRSLTWDDQKLVIEPECGLSPIFPGDAALEVIDRAGRDARGRSEEA